MLTIADARAVYAALINGEPPAFYERIIRICSYLWLKPLTNQDRTEVRAIKVLAEQMIGIETPMRHSYHGCLLVLTRSFNLYVAYSCLRLVCLERHNLNRWERRCAFASLTEENDRWVQDMNPSDDDQKRVNELLIAVSDRQAFALAS